MKANKNVVIKKGCHCRTYLSAIYNALKNTRWGSPTKTLGDDANEYTGMTPNFKEEALNKGAFRAPLRSGFILRPSSFRSVSMRDIGAAPRSFTARSVTPQCWYAGYSGRTGFTLIELLVVVLIIGILAAVAVPQYQKAVLKSQFTTMIPLAKAVADAQETYYLGSGDYTNKLSDLDVSVPGNPTGATTTLQDGTQIKLGVEENHIFVRSEKENNALMIYQKNSPNFAGETHCEAKLDNTIANWLCEKGLEGTLVGKKFGYNIYALDTTDPNSTLGRIYYNTPPSRTLSDGDECVSNIAGGCRNLIFKDGAICTSSYRGCNGNEAEFINATCVSTGSQSCGQYGNTLFDNSKCEAHGAWDCSGRFRNGSICISAESASGSCAGSVGSYTLPFSDRAVCRGRTDTNGSCYRIAFTGKSVCSGEGKTACYNNSFADHSYCKADKNGSCVNNTYDTTSFCTSANGYCPTGTPKGTWNESTETYELNGWNGGCCNASYMIGGVCPSGATVCSE